MAKGDLAPGSTVGRYVVEEVVGQGGMSTVYRARHATTRKRVALKVLKHRLDETRQKLWLQEAQVEETIGASPHLVQILDADLDPASGLTFLAMELLEGQTVAERIESRQPLARAEVMDLLRQLTALLHQAHTRGVIHRDLKPHNLFLVRRDDGSTLLKVLDFGAARVQQGGQRTATHLGTELYAAPEQRGGVVRKLAEARGLALARDVSPASDVWALALIAYEMFTGYEPGHLWGDRDSNELIFEGVPRPSESAGARRDRLPRGFDAWFARCTQLDASQRYASIQEALAALEALDATATPTQAPAAPASPETRLKVATFHAGGSPAPTSSPPAVAAPPRVEPARAGPSTHLGSVQTFHHDAPAEAPPAAHPRKPGLVVVAVAGGVGLVALAGLLASRGGERPDLTPPGTSAPPPTARASASASVSTPALPSAPAKDAVDERRAKLVGEMVTIPAGTLLRGAGAREADEKPTSEVAMPSFRMDRTEVTVAAWKLCLQEQGCTEQKGVQSADFSASEATSWSRYCTLDLPGHEQHPINCVDAAHAEAFCQWAGKRLPTEDEWEYAARGVTTTAAASEQLYPWGKETPGPSRLNVCDQDCVTRLKADGFKDFDRPMFTASDGFGATAPAGKFPANAFGLVDLAGNVSEWTASAYSRSHGGPTDTTLRVSRGAHWEHTEVTNVRAARRFKDRPDTRDVVLGFRCARGL